MFKPVFKRIAVSNRELYEKYHGTGRMEDYAAHLTNLEQVNNPPDILILREKDLSEEAYAQLLEKLWKKVEHSKIELIPHTYLLAAQSMGIDRIHLPLPMLKKYRNAGRDVEEALEQMHLIGTSVHSVEEAKEAEQLGANYVTAGHIFTTDCKAGLEPRGIEFLEKVCENVRIPVYAIGGIHPENIAQIEKSSAAGACMMSEYMKEKSD